MSGEEKSLHDLRVDTDLEDKYRAVEADTEISSFFSRQFRRLKKFIPRYYRGMKERRRDELYNKHLTAKDQDPAQTSMGPPGMWNNIVPNFVITFLSYLRTALVGAHKSFPRLIPAVPKDAFWVLSQAPAWLTWLPNQIGYGLSKILSIAPFLSKIAPYLPLVGTVVVTIQAGITFYQEKNKNFFSTLKFIANVAAFTLLGVATSFIIWGGIAAIATTVPYLLLAATAVVATVGLIRTGVHLYKAYKDSAHRKQHLINAAKELLATFIQAASIVCLFVGVQVGHQLLQFTQSFDIAFLKKASALYAQLPVLTNITLIATGLLAVEGIAKGVSYGFKKAAQGVNYLADKSPTIKKITNAISNTYRQCKNYLIRKLLPAKKPPKTQDDINNEKASLIAEIVEQIDTLNKQIRTSNEVKKDTNFITKKLKTMLHPNDRRNKKLELLYQAKNVLEENKSGIEMTADLKNVERKALFGEKDAFFTSPTTVYQSFFSTQGRTEELMKKTIKFAEEIEPTARP